MYPTETVYGLGADALSPPAIDRVFAAKSRDRDDPMSLAVPSVEDASALTRPTEIERAFMDEFLPGPVTVLLGKRSAVPDRLTAGRSRVGVRIPDHELALALLERVAPITATSANVSGRPAVTRPAALDPAIEEAVSVVLDGGETPGGPSTVVDVSTGEIHRRGPRAAAIADWLEQRS